MTAITPFAPLRYLQERLRQSNLQIPVEAVDDQSLLSLISDGYRRLCEEGQALRTITRIADVIDQAEYTLPDDHYRTLRVYRGGVKQLRIPDSEALEGAQTGYYEYDGHIGISPTPGSGVPPVTTYAEDTFDRVVTAGDTFGPLSGGGEWEKRYLTTLASCDGSTGALATVAAGETVANVVSAETLQDGHFRATVSWDFNTVASTHEVGVCARQDASNDGYRAVLREEADNTVSIVLVKTVAGVTTDVDSETAGTQYNAGDQWVVDYQIEAGTHTITAGKLGTDEDEWATILTTDFDISTEGAYGVIATSGDAIPPTFRFDDYSATSIPVTVAGGPETFLLYCRDPEPLTTWDDSFDADFPTEFIYALVHYVHYRVATMIGGEGEISKANWHRQEFNQACKDLLDRVNSLDQARIGRVQGATQGQRELDPFSPRERFRPSTGGGTGTIQLGSLASKNKVSLTDLDFDVATQEELDALAAQVGASASRHSFTETFGAVGDGVLVLNVRGAAGGSVLVADNSGTTGNGVVKVFDSTMVGKKFMIAGALAHGAPAAGTITGYLSATSVTVRVDIAGGDVNNQFQSDFVNGNALIGTDNAAAWDLAMQTLKAAGGGRLEIDTPSPWGMYLFFTEPQQWNVDGLEVSGIGGRGAAGAHPYKSFTRLGGVMIGCCLDIRIMNWTGLGSGSSGTDNAGPFVKNVAFFNPGPYKGTRGPEAIRFKGMAHTVVQDWGVFNFRRGCVYETLTGYDTSWTANRNCHSRGTGIAIETDNSAAIAAGGAQGANNAEITGGDFQVYDTDIGVSWATGYGRIGLFKLAMHGAQEWSSGQRFMLGTKVQPTTSNGHIYEITGVPAYSAGTVTTASEPSWPTDGSSASDANGFEVTDLGAPAYGSSTTGLRLQGKVGVTDGGESHHVSVLPISVERSGHDTQPFPTSITIDIQVPSGSVSVHGCLMGGGGDESQKGTGVRIYGTANTPATGCAIIGGQMSRCGIGVDVGPYVDHFLVTGVDLGGNDQPLRVDALAARTRFRSCNGDNPTDVDVDPNDSGEQTSVSDWSYYGSGTSNKDADMWRRTTGVPADRVGIVGDFAMDRADGSLYKKTTNTGSPRWTLV